MLLRVVLLLMLLLVLLVVLLLVLVPAGRRGCSSLAAACLPVS
jgi:hypothetical protein